MRLLLLFLLIATPVLAQEPKPILIAKPEAFQTLVNPNCSHCVDEAKRRKEELKDSDTVLCWTRGYSGGGAIPLRFFLNTYRVISDSYGVFVYDPDAGYARGFAASYDFEFYGWRNGVMVMRAKSDGTLFSCLSGLAFEGKRKGEQLKPIPTMMSTWGEVMQRNPNAVAYQMFEKYKPKELEAKPNEDSAKSRPAKVDGRLKPDALVLGVRVGNKTRAYPLNELQEEYCQKTDSLEGVNFVILSPNSAFGNSPSAYRTIASQPRKWKGPKPDKDGISPADAGVPIPDGKELEPVALGEFKDTKTGPWANDSCWGKDGRSTDGPLKDWTLEPLDCVVCKWYAWSMEYPDTEVSGEKKPAPLIDPNKKVKQVAGSAEFLRLLPKPFGVVKDVDAANRTVTLLLDGDKTAKRWPVEPDAEVWVDGFWGRLDQLPKNAKAWSWLKLDKNKNPIAVAMIADETSTTMLRHDPDNKTPLAKDAEAKRLAQRDKMRTLWASEGLPGTLAFNHTFSGELDVILDHEAMRWGRGLAYGDSVELNGIKAVVKTVTPWRERTQVRLVVGELQASELKTGMRVLLKCMPPSREVDDAETPPDIDRKRSTEERVDWFLCNIYCVCGVGNDTCTGHFYTLASCNPNGCGAPNATRDELREQIKKGLSDKQIWDALLMDRGPLMLRPHLKP
jgi:hypothetical protein